MVSFCTPMSCIGSRWLSVVTGVSMRDSILTKWQRLIRKGSEISCKWARKFIINVAESVNLGWTPTTRWRANLLCIGPLLSLPQIFSDRGLEEYYYVTNSVKTCPLMEDTEKMLKHFEGLLDSAKELLRMASSRWPLCLDLEASLLMLSWKYGLCYVHRCSWGLDKGTIIAECSSFIKLTRRHYTPLFFATQELSEVRSLGFQVS